MLHDAGLIMLHGTYYRYIPQLTCIFWRTGSERP